MIAVRLTADEKSEIVAAARRTGMFPSGFLATAGLAEARGFSTVLHATGQLDTAIDELAALRAQISRVGNNINQIAYIYNSGSQPRPVVLDHTLTRLVHTLTRIDEAAETLARQRA
ncbi:plasmid mobilization protein [Streptomyces silvisoli]|uniref:Plasmid mobilization relaxosome protein MobC n=1 Tax=Streptomyces silvisoli TaxID=3034235 RepID=A0ABT5ZPZ7_9ACTN|nr:plasmid mobilization relaxosome protein MobC [Streptomyces silvisoli]MDF3291904.1 plasmid mobilization relaxosome protein MobC [Streptomyces silvisoli]